MLTIEDRACTLTDLYWNSQDKTPTIDEIVETYKVFVEKLKIE